VSTPITYPATTRSRVTRSLKHIRLSGLNRPCSGRSVTGPQSRHALARRDAHPIPKRAHAALTGRPSVMTRHCEHCPFAQKSPCGLPSLWWWPNTLIPAATSDDEVISHEHQYRRISFQVIAWCFYRELPERDDYEFASVYDG
jgi:hypothetical protein